MKLYRINGNTYINTNGRYSSEYQMLQRVMQLTGSSISTTHDCVEFLSPYVSLYDVERALAQMGFEQVTVVDIVKKEV